MHQTYFLIDGSQFLVETVPNFVLCNHFCLIICVFDMVQILTIWEDACTLRNKDESDYATACSKCFC